MLKTFFFSTQLMDFIENESFRCLPIRYKNTGTPNNLVGKQPRIVSNLSVILCEMTEFLILIYNLLGRKNTDSRL